MKNYNWAIIGCGGIANEMAQAFSRADKAFYSVYNRTKANAISFAEKYNINKICDNVDELLADENVDIVYIATPHNSHIDYILKALENGKHVLCEKAITLNSRELEEAVDLAERKGLILAEAMTIFHCPVYNQLDEIINSGKLGKLKMIQVNLGSHKDYDMTNRFFNMDLAGGAMLDIGVYALSFARYFMSECPNEILSQMKKAPTGADEQVNIILKNNADEMATVTLSLTAKLPKLGIAAFENGYISLDNYNRTYKAEITYTDTDETVVVKSGDSVDALGCEFRNMEKAVSGEENKMHLDYTRDVMKIMTKVRNEHKMLYKEELNILKNLSRC